MLVHNTHTQRHTNAHAHGITQTGEKSLFSLTKDWIWQKRESKTGNLSLGCFPLLRPGTHSGEAQGLTGVTWLLQDTDCRSAAVGVCLCLCSSCSCSLLLISPASHALSPFCSLFLPSHLCLSLLGEGGNMSRTIELLFLRSSYPETWHIYTGLDMTTPKTTLPGAQTTQLQGSETWPLSHLLA